MQCVACLMGNTFCRPPVHESVTFSCRSTVLQQRVDPLRRQRSGHVQIFRRTLSHPSRSKSTWSHSRRHLESAATGRDGVGHGTHFAPPSMHVQRVQHSVLCCPNSSPSLYVALPTRQTKEEANATFSLQGRGESVYLRFFGHAFLLHRFPVRVHSHGILHCLPLTRLRPIHF